jgi:hypothetical protein
MTPMKKEKSVGRCFTYTLEELAHMFVDHDHIASREWDKKYAEKIVVLAEHFGMPPGSTVIDTLREAMAVALHVGKPFDIHPDEPTPTEE